MARHYLSHKDNNFQMLKKCILIEHALVTFILLHKNNMWPLFQILWMFSCCPSVEKSGRLQSCNKSAEICFPWSRQLKIWLKSTQVAEIKSADFVVWKFKKTILPIIFVKKNHIFIKLVVKLQQVMLTNEFYH